MSNKVLQHFYLVVAPEGEPESWFRRWMAYFRRVGIHPDRVLAASPAEPFARDLAARLNRPWQLLTSPHPPQPWPARRLEQAALWRWVGHWAGEVAVWLDRGEDLLFIGPAPVIQVVAQVCLGLPVPEAGLEFFLPPGALLHLSYAATKDRWVIQTLNPLLEEDGADQTA